MIVTSELFLRKNTMADDYLEGKTRLNGQPKKTLGEYVESQGILVPRRFATLQEARESGLPVIARSEHQQDYNGVSGLVDSAKLNDEKYLGIQDEETLKAKILEEPEMGISQHKQLCGLLGLDLERFKQEITFSYWELLGGFNRVVVADSSVPNRHHVMTRLNWEEGKPGLYNYAVVDNGLISREFIKNLPQELREGLSELIRLYEDVRHLGRFNPNHCPIMEIQTLGTKNYFLQYHRTRDFEPVQFCLERSAKDGEIEMPFVRGATSSDGMTCKTTTHYSGELDWSFGLREEEGSFDLHYRKPFIELMTRKRKLQMIPMSADNQLYFTLMGFVVDHKWRSELFKPQVSVICNLGSFMTHPDEHTDWYLESKKGQDHYLNLHVVSDGKRALVKRL